MLKHIVPFWHQFQSVRYYLCAIKQISESKYEYDMQKKNRSIRTLERFIHQVSTKQLQQLIKEANIQHQQMFKFILDYSDQDQASKSYQVRDWVKQYSNYINIHQKTKYDSSILASILATNKSQKVNILKTGVLKISFSCYGSEPTKQSYCQNYQKQIIEHKKQMDNAIMKKIKEINQNSSQENQNIRNNFEKYIQKTRHKKQLPESVIILLANQFLKITKNEKVKARRRIYKQRYCNFILENIDNVKSKQGYIFIIKFLFQILQVSSQGDRIRLSKVAVKIEKNILQRLKTDSSFSKDITYSQKNMSLLINIVGFFDACDYPMKREAQNLFFSMITNLEQIQNFSNYPSLIRSFMSYYRYFPQTVLIDQKGDVTTNKIKLHQWFFDILLPNNPNIELAFQQYQVNYIQTFCLYIAEAMFYKSYLELKTQEINGFLVITEKPKLPTLPQGILIRYEQIAGKFKFRNKIFFQLYTDFYSRRNPGETQQQIKKKCSKFKLGQINYDKYNKNYDNQIINRVLKELQNLNLQFVREQKVGAKMADFIVNYKGQKIIVECEGDVHYNFWTQQINCKTAYRNMIYMLNGYKIVTINYVELNISRESISGQNYIKQLLQKKFEIIQKQGRYCI